MSSGPTVRQYIAKMQAETWSRAGRSMDIDHAVPPEVAPVIHGISLVEAIIVFDQMVRGRVSAVATVMGGEERFPAGAVEPRVRCWFTPADRVTLRDS